MSTTGTPAVATGTRTVPGPVRDERWLRAARRARQLSWASLVWMSVEGVVGLTAGVRADSLSLVVWAASSFVEAMASITIVWLYTGSRLHSHTSERTAQRWVAGSFLLVVPYFLYESFERLLNGSETHFSGLGAAVTISAILLMPLLAWAKLRLARQLGSGATAGEGVQNLLCAAQAAAALVALIGAGAGLAILDPIAAFVISAIAIKECTALWRGDGEDCCAPIGFDGAPAGGGGASTPDAADSCATAAPRRPATTAGTTDCCDDGCCTPTPGPARALPVTVRAADADCHADCCR